MAKHLAADPYSAWLTDLTTRADAAHLEAWSALVQKNDQSAALYARFELLHKMELIAQEFVDSY